MNQHKKVGAQKSLEPVAARKDSPLAQFADKVGKVEILEKDNASKTVPAHGFYCSTCKASFTSSDAYLDHCNGKIHQKNMGVTLKVERIEAVDRVKARIEMLSKKQSEGKAVEKETSDPKQQRKERKKLKKIEQEQHANEDEQISKEDTNDEDLMASVMGFKSFS